MVQDKRDTNYHFVGVSGLQNAFTLLYWTMVKTRTGPGMLTARLKHEAIFRLQGHLDQAHVILLLEGT
jgi:hypothetical protein